MGRPTKYYFGTIPVTITIPENLKDFLKRKAAKHNKSLSEFITLILKSSINDNKSYADIMMKHHNKLFYYWKNEKERLERE